MRPPTLPCVVLVVLLVGLPATAQIKDLYHDPDHPFQGMAYDAATGMIHPQPVWLHDTLVHCYPFRAYAPPTYGMHPRVVGAEVPLNKIYLPSTNATLWGVPKDQLPILASGHYLNGTPDPLYSDFALLLFYQVEPGYKANTHRSIEQVLTSGFKQFHATTTIVNMPLVPDGTRLADPHPNRTVAPIFPWSAWLDGRLVTTYVFESNSRVFADWINARTRAPAFREGSGYEASAAPSLAVGNHGVDFGPLWHLNQYETGVTPRVNNGMPWATGQRNVIAWGRADVDYSPLRQVVWVSQVPAGYSADQASSGEALASPGFRLTPTSILLNCPIIGPDAGAVNQDRARKFRDAVGGGTVTLEGALVLHGNESVDFVAEGKTIGTATTEPDGSYRLTFDRSDVPSGARAVEAVFADEVVASWPVGEDNTSPGAAWAAVVLGLVAAAVLRRR